MSKRFTDTDKWKKIWFRKLSPLLKCVWVYICDSCDIAGIWEVDFELMEYFIGEKLDEKDIRSKFDKQYQELDSGKKWLLKDYVSFQYGQLVDNNNMHRSVINLLKNSGASQGLNSPLAGDKVKVKVKDKVIKGVVGGKLSDEDFLKTLKESYDWVDIESEFKKMDVWLLDHRGRKKTRRFIINWVNKIDKPFNGHIEKKEFKDPYLQELNNLAKQKEERLSIKK